MRTTPPPPPPRPTTTTTTKKPVPEIEIEWDMYRRTTRPPPKRPPPTTKPPPATTTPGFWWLFNMPTAPTTPAPVYVHVPVYQEKYKFKESSCSCYKGYDFCPGNKYRNGDCINENDAIRCCGFD
jgi:hypothetical protein